MHHDRRAGHRVQLLQASDMIDVGVRAHDEAHGKGMSRQGLEDAIDVVARIEHQSFARFRIAQNRAVALQPADGQHFVNHLLGHRCHYNIEAWKTA